MKMSLFAALAALGMLANISFAQLDLGGTISGAINQATGGAAGNTSGNAVGSAAAQVGTPATPALPQPGSAANAANANADVNAGVNAAAQVGGQAGSQTNAQVGTQLGAQSGTRSGTQLGTQSGTQLGTQSTNQAATNLPGNNTLNGNQTWLGRVRNDLRAAVQQAENGTLRLQNNINQSLQQMGLRSGDQLLGDNGQPLTQQQFDSYLQSNPNQVRILRNGQIVVLDNFGPANAQGANGQRFYGQGSYAQGSYAQGSYGQGVNANNRLRLGITMNPSQEAVVVSGVVQDSPAALAGLRPGDQILAVNGQAVNNPNSMIRLVAQADVQQAVDLQYRRNGQVMQSQVMLASGSSGQMNSGLRSADQGSYQAGYGRDVQGQDDISSRLDRLERMVEDLSERIRELSDK